MEKQFMTFSIADGIYGINILGIKEINYSSRFTAVPLAADHLVGLLNLRGQIVTILDMSLALGYKTRDIHDETSLLIMKTNMELSHVARKHGIDTHTDQVGFMVDRIGDVISCDESEIESVPAHIDVDVSKYLEGVVKRDDSLVGIINVPELLKYP
ncbi:Purine-binding chemotaxis protein CheW [Sulfidibacter corallicola]|uniref:Purine-binding chemotaxis protein CheW n=1 Tax=Sulfidibacter corallicola TaxID=2818388 RepID=A0A8A4TF30_SULCO|nr:chemotaxis protein CheW [Sulfidibacter corallicola]QTD47822.1 purine-binding chemotaxis protein CheW [Sulfidibacter corallicola]